MKEAKTFYYRFDKINAWFVFNAALLITMLLSALLVADAGFMGRNRFFLAGLEL